MKLLNNNFFKWIKINIFIKLMVFSFNGLYSKKYEVKKKYMENIEKYINCNKSLYPFSLIYSCDAK